MNGRQHLPNTQKPNCLNPLTFLCSCVAVHTRSRELIQLKFNQFSVVLRGFFSTENCARCRCTLNLCGFFPIFSICPTGNSLFQAILWTLTVHGLFFLDFAIENSNGERLRVRWKKLGVVSRWCIVAANVYLTLSETMGLFVDFATSFFVFYAHEALI